jgi:hypothetical protein
LDNEQVPGVRRGAARDAPCGLQGIIS